jgi:1-deoxy-D-xylulose-5-phosphate synthase
MGRMLAARAENDEKICAITAAMSYGTGLEGFRKAYPQRFFDVGIAEEHAVTFAAGLSASGYKPVFAVYSTFLQRSYDQMIHDVALQNLPVVFCIDRAGFNAADGATHHGIFDVAFISQIKGFKIYTPVTYKGLEISLDRALSGNCPTAIRYPSGCECEEIKNAFYKDRAYGDISIRCLIPDNKTPDYVIVTHGRIAKECLKAKAELEKRNICVGVILCEYLAPYDELADEILGKISNISPRTLIFIEEEIRSGGFGENTIAAIKKKTGRIDIAYDIIATDDPFVRRNEGQSYESAAGVDSSAIVERITSLDA